MAFSYFSLLWSDPALFPPDSFCFQRFILLNILVVGAVVLQQIFVAERPLVRNGGPGLGQHLWIFDCYLVVEIIHAGAAKPLDYVLLIAVKPAYEVVPGPLINRNHVDDQGVRIPMTNSIASECGIRIFRMRSPVGMYDPEIVIQFVQLNQLSGCLDQLDGIGINNEHSGNPAGQAVHRGASELKIGLGHTP